jgi:hypothetical protein
VKVLELTARAAPSFDAPVLQVLSQGTELAVSGGVTNGWREAVLGDGRKAYVADPGLEIRAATAGAATSGAPARPASIALTPRLYVKDVDHLAELVKDDTVVSPMAQSLVTRRNAAVGAIVTGAGVGVLLIILSVTSLKTTSCLDGNPQFCSTEPNEGLFVGGIGLIGLGNLVGLLVYPKRNDLLDLVNNWNARHVDNQFSIESHELGFGGH